MPFLETETEGVCWSLVENGTEPRVRPGPAVKLTVFSPTVSWTVAVSLSIAKAKTASTGKSEFLGSVPVEQEMALG